MEFNHQFPIGLGLQQIMFKVTLVLGLVALSQAGVQLGYGIAAGPALGLAVAPAHGLAVAAAAPINEKTTVLANNQPGQGGHAPNNLITLVRSQDGGYVPGEEPDPPVIQRPTSTVYRTDDNIHGGVVGVGPHGEAVHAGRPYAFGYINRNENGGDFSHHEKTDAGNRRTGSYGFTGADGTYRRVEYVADEHGYRAKVSTNEQGTASHAAADALTVAEKPPYLQYSPPAAQVVKAVAPVRAVVHAAPVLHAAPALLQTAHATPVYRSVGYAQPALALRGGLGLAHGGLIQSHGLALGGLRGGLIQSHGLALGGLRGGYIQAPGIAQRGLSLGYGGLVHG